MQAALHGCSMEEEARKILRQAISNNPEEKGFGSFLHSTFVEAGGFNVPTPPRSTPRHSNLFEDEK